MTTEDIKEMLHFARKKEQRLWGTGDEHQEAHDAVVKLENLLENEE